MSGPLSVLRCTGCGTDAAVSAPFRCPQARPGDDIDHVVARTLTPGAVTFPSGLEPNPYVRYRQLFHAHHLALSHGVTDAQYTDMVIATDRAIEAVDGVGFRVTPFEAQPALGSALGRFEGEVWVKDETGNVSGSHKARHLVGTLHYLRVLEMLGLRDAADDTVLAIASCGNAALAAGVLARAARQTLEVFIPPWADGSVVERLRRLGAHLVICERTGQEAGDPCYAAFRERVLAGALPFSVQGPDNGLAVESGLSLGYEIADALRVQDVHLDRLFVQVGGGALASGLIQALREAVGLGIVARMPIVHVVQAAAVHPVRRAYDAVVRRMSQLDGLCGEGQSQGPADPARVERALAYAVTHRSAFMRPWETEPNSVASGILDDETYDWFGVVRGLLETGGDPVVVSEDDLVAANEIGREACGIDASFTGTAGLAGLLRLVRSGAVASGERVGLVFTGIRR